jgi:hypothetical protein
MKKQRGVAEIGVLVVLLIGAVTGLFIEDEKDVIKDKQEITE